MKRHLSVSQLNTLTRCPQQFYHRYVLGEKRPPGVALVIGKGVHAAVEKDLGAKLEWGELLPDDSIADFAADATRRLWKQDEPVRTEDDPDEGGAIDEAVKLAELHHEKVAPVVEPVALERPFVLEVPDFSFDIKGVVDVEETNVIRDTKTSAKAPSGNPATKSLQGELYTLEAKVRGHDKAFVLDHLVRGKTARYIPSHATFTENDHRSFLKRVEQFGKMVESGSFPPTDPTNWACSAKWCGWWDSCDWGARQKVTVGLIDPSRLTSRVAERRP